MSEYYWQLAESPDWLRDELKRVGELSDLTDDWDSYGAEAPNDIALRLARRVVGVAGEMNVRPTAIRASVEGGVCISFTSGIRYGDLECFNSGELLAVTSAESEATHAWEVKKPEFAISQSLKHIHDFVR